MHQLPRPSHRVICDNCERPLSSEEFYLHCDICSGGDFDICQTCANTGRSCYNSEHTLKRICEILSPRQSQVLQPNETYQYRTLPEKYIRIIQFPSNLPSGPLEFSLFQTSIQSLQSSVDYFALSYVWGHERLYENVICNGAPMDIPSGLHKIILHMYDLGLAIRFWIDAICINQEDGGEKACQIPMMRNIYHSCTRAIVWLGESDENTPMAIDTLKGHALTESSSHTTCLEAISLLDEAHGSRRTDISTAQQKAVMDLFRRPWFTCTWVVQEVYLWEEGRAPLVFCGRHHMSWHGIVLAWERISKFKLRAPTRRGPQAAPTACFISHSLMLRRAAKISTSLLELLVWSRPLRATDPRDKVYAVLGLMTSMDIQIKVQQSLDPRATTDDEISQQQHHPTILIDYRRTVGDLYEEVARVVISVTKSLEILCFVGRSTSSQNELPSWVPDWATQPPTSPLLVPDQSTSNHAANHSAAYVELRSTPGFLGAAAFFCDSIAETADTCATGGDGRDIARLMMKLWICFGSKISTYPGGGSPVDAFWRTSMANVRSDTPEHIVPSDRFGRTFLTLALVMLHAGDLEDLGCVRPSCVQTSVCQCCGETKEIRRCGTRMTRPIRAHALGIGHDVSDRESSTSPPWVHGIHALSSPDCFRDIGRCLMEEITQFVDNIDPEACLYTDQLVGAAKAAMLHRRFFITSRGYFGIGPADAKPEDLVVVLKGGPLPFILRPSKVTGQEVGLLYRRIFRLIGESYVHGLSAGEAIASMTDPESLDAWEKVLLS